jgi:hypothetical protein
MTDNPGNAMITAADIKKLLKTGDDSAALVLIEGRAEVVSGHELDSEPYRGALPVIGRDDLVGRIGSDPSEHELVEQAAVIDSAISEMGG